MKKILSISAFAALICFTSFSAQAAEGCGPGFHRGGNGRCYPNGAGAWSWFPVRSLLLRSE